MEKFTIDLDEYHKLSSRVKIFNFLLGSFLTVFSGITIFRMVGRGSQFGEYLFFLILLIVGINVIVYTFGVYYRVSRRYVEINDNCFEYKLSYFATPRIIAWKDMTKVEIRTLRVFFHTKGGAICKMKLGDIFYRDIRRIKDTLTSVCIEKEIRCIDKTTSSAGRITKSFGRNTRSESRTTKSDD